MVFTVTGGGSFCSGGSVVSVSLIGSEVGISYQLKRDGNNVGNSVTGTGGNLNFGIQNIAGNYAVTATNPTTFCSNIMNGSALVTVGSTPPKPSVPMSVSFQCDADFSGNEPISISHSCAVGSSPVWFINGNPAGSLPNTTFASNGDLTYIQPVGTTQYSYACRFTTAPFCQGIASDVNPVTVIGGLSTPIPQSSSIIICLGRTAILLASGCSGEGVTTQWYRSSDNLPVTASVSPLQTTDYYAKCVKIIDDIIICSGTSSTFLRVQVNEAVTTSLVITQPITSGTIIQSASIIEATNQISGGNVEYRATQSITLNPGFSAMGSNFKANIVGCD